MIKELSLALLPSEATEPTIVRQRIVQHLALKSSNQFEFELIRKSIDARGSSVKIILKLRVYIDEAQIPEKNITYEPVNVAQAEAVHIIGAGPAGLFSALRCIELGLKPVIFERGKNVRERRRDLAILNKEGVLNEESNYCFGEGGAGTYSDGKLYTRSTKRGNVQRVLELFHYFGADKNILVEAHPHIGTNKLPGIIEAMRNKIIECGGEVHFNARLTDMQLADGRIRNITINQHQVIEVKHLILATGHSANDIYELLFRKQILIESKPFALGVRVEHPQHLIDQVQYHCQVRDALLPPASYSLVEQIGDRGVFSFCMCPGGIIAPASTQQEKLVVNGWSPSKRNNPFANSGMVVSIDQRDYKAEDPLAGLAYQARVEELAFQAGGGKFKAPAQRMSDFIDNKYSGSLSSCSYVPGIASSKLSDVLPEVVYQSLSKAFRQIGRKMKAFLSNEAMVVATESRTSSPVRIPRDKESLRHPQCTNLFPCAEGAGYAGGIVSAAMDGMKVAESIAMQVGKNISGGL